MVKKLVGQHGLCFVVLGNEQQPRGVFVYAVYKVGFDGFAVAARLALKIE